MSDILLTQLRNLARKLESRGQETYAQTREVIPRETRAYYEGQSKAFKEAENLLLRFMLENNLYKMKKNKL